MFNVKFVEVITIKFKNMKTFKLFILGTFLLAFSFSNAQVSVNVNLGKPPVWGPTVTTEEYYYLPEIDLRFCRYPY